MCGSRGGGVAGAGGSFVSLVFFSFGRPVKYKGIKIGNNHCVISSLVMPLVSSSVHNSLEELLMF